MAQFYISATHKSSGKTTLSIGVCAALAARGVTVRPFKKGPDYIDPIWLSRASGHACHNLDFHTASPAYNLNLFTRYAGQQQVALVEGNMGLFDGLALDGSNSNAAMAKLLGLPVVLVVDCSGTSGGIAPLLMGYRQFDPDVRYAGVILNKLAGQRHETRIRSFVEHYTDFTILGAIHRSKEIQLSERHLGLIPSNEIGQDADSIIGALAGIVQQSVDLDALTALPDVIKAPPVKEKPKSGAAPASLRIAIARDEAFGFYYPGDLDRFGELGVDLIDFDTTHSPRLPDNIDGLFIGGGFPESRLAQLAANQTLRQSIKSAIAGGLPAYAECGGLMYLCDSMGWEGKDYDLCGVIPARVDFSQRPQGRGYVSLQPTANHPWYSDQTARPEILHAHEFHYSSLVGLSPGTAYAYAMRRGKGIDGLNDGIIQHNLLASYVHLRRTDQCSWVDDFVSFVHQVKSN